MSLDEQKCLNMHRLNLQWKPHLIEFLTLILQHLLIHSIYDPKGLSWSPPPFDIFSDKMKATHGNGWQWFQLLGLTGYFLFYDIEFSMTLWHISFLDHDRIQRTLVCLVRLYTSHWMSPQSLFFILQFVYSLSLIRSFYCCGAWDGAKTWWRFARVTFYWCSAIQFRPVFWQIKTMHFFRTPFSFFLFPNTLALRMIDLS